MYENITEQFQNSLDPINEMFANNANILVKLTQQQSKLFTDVLNEGVACTKDLSEQNDWPGVLNAQMAFVEKVQSKIVTAFEDANKLFSEAQEKTNESMKPFFSQEKPAPSRTTKPAK